MKLHQKIFARLRHPEDFGDDIKAKLEAKHPRAASKIVKHLNHVSQQARPGIIDMITHCDSREMAHTLFHEFLDSATNPSNKTISRAKRLLETLDFPQP